MTTRLLSRLLSRGHHPAPSPSTPVRPRSQLVRVRACNPIDPATGELPKPF